MSKCARCGREPAVGETVHFVDGEFLCDAHEADPWRQLNVAGADLVAAVWDEVQRPIVWFVEWLARRLERFHA